MIVRILLFIILIIILSILYKLFQSQIGIKESYSNCGDLSANTYFDASSIFGLDKNNTPFRFHIDTSCSIKPFIFSKDISGGYGWCDWYGSGVGIDNYDDVSCANLDDSNPLNVYDISVNGVDVSNSINWTTLVGMSGEGLRTRFGTMYMSDWQYRDDTSCNEGFTNYDGSELNTDNAIWKSQYNMYPYQNGEDEYNHEEDEYDDEEDEYDNEGQRISGRSWGSQRIGDRIENFTVPGMTKKEGVWSTSNCSYIPHTRNNPRTLRVHYNRGNWGSVNRCDKGGNFIREKCVNKCKDLGAACDVVTIQRQGRDNDEKRWKREKNCGWGLCQFKTCPGKENDIRGAEKGTRQVYGETWVSDIWLNKMEQRKADEAAAKKKANEAAAKKKLEAEAKAAEQELKATTEVCKLAGEIVSKYNFIEHYMQQIDPLTGSINKSEDISYIQKQILKDYQHITSKNILIQQLRKNYNNSEINTCVNNANIKANDAKTLLQTANTYVSNAKKVEKQHACSSKIVQEAKDTSKDILNKGDQATIDEFKSGIKIIDYLFSKNEDCYEGMGVEAVQFANMRGNRRDLESAQDNLEIQMSANLNKDIIQSNYCSVLSNFSLEYGQDMYVYVCASGNEASCNDAFGTPDDISKAEMYQYDRYENNRRQFFKDTSEIDAGYTNLMSGLFADEQELYWRDISNQFEIIDACGNVIGNRDEVEYNFYKGWIPSDNSQDISAQITYTGPEFGYNLVNDADLRKQLPINSAASSVLTYNSNLNTYCGNVCFNNNQLSNEGDVKTNLDKSPLAFLENYNE